MKLMHTRTDLSYTAQFDTTLRNKCYCKSWNTQIDKSLRKIQVCHYQQNVPQHYYLLDTLHVDTLHVVALLILIYTLRGAGQEVGRSCHILEFKGKKVMVCKLLFSKSTVM